MSVVTHKSKEMTLWSCLDSRSVGDIIHMLSDYPLEAIIIGNTQKHPHYPDVEVFHIEWEESV